MNSLKKLFIISVCLVFCVVFIGYAHAGIGVEIDNATDITDVDNIFIINSVDADSCGIPNNEGTYFEMPLLNPPLVNNGFPATPPELFEAQTGRDWEVDMASILDPPDGVLPVDLDFDEDGTCFLAEDFEYALTPAGNGGWYRWRIVLQEKPHSDINLKIRGCIVENEGRTVYKPDALDEGTTASDSAAGQTGAFHLNSNVINFIASANPTIKVWAEPGPYSTFSTPFNMTGIVIPSGLSRDSADDGVVLDGSSDTRFNLIGNFAANIVMCMPGSGTNAKGQDSAVLHQGDMIEVIVTIPGNNVVDVRLGRDSAWVEYNAIVGTSIDELPALPWSVGPGEPLSLDDYLTASVGN